MEVEPIMPVFTSPKTVLTFALSCKIVVFKMNISKDFTLEINVAASERREFVLISSCCINANKLPLVSVIPYNTWPFLKFKDLAKTKRNNVHGNPYVCLQKCNSGVHTIRPGNT